MFFDGWESLTRIAVLAAATYAAALVALRLFGQEALAKMSAYDLIVTIALGSIIASIPLNERVTITDGVTVIAVYLLLQALLRRVIHRSRRVRRMVKEPPHLVVWEGHFLEDQLESRQIVREEVCAAVRRAGHGSLLDIQAVLLENDGEWSVVPRSQAGDLSAFAGLELPRTAVDTQYVLRFPVDGRREGESARSTRP